LVLTAPGRTSDGSDPQCPGSFLPGSFLPWVATQLTQSPWLRKTP
jgi:hypothetical protein